MGIREINGQLTYGEMRSVESNSRGCGSREKGPLAQTKDGRAALRMDDLGAKALGSVGMK